MEFFEHSREFGRILNIAGCNAVHPAEGKNHVARAYKPFFHARDTATFYPSQSDLAGVARPGIGGFEIYGNRTQLRPADASSWNRLRPQRTINTAHDDALNDLGQEHRGG